MYELIVEPLMNVGDVYFGMSREDVRKILGGYTEFKKNKYSENTTDDFKFCHVFYDKENKCEAIEIFQEVKVKIGDIEIFPGDLKEAVNYLRNIDEKLEIDNVGCISKNKSIGIYAPYSKMESILFGKKDYYDE